MLKLDDLQLNDLMIYQDTDYFCFGVDSVCLANFVADNANIKPTTKIIDFCSGCGVIPILLSAKTNADIIEGIELQPQMLELANKSIDYNNLHERVKIRLGDIKNKTAIKSDFYDVVTINPPYKPVLSGATNANDVKTIARHEVECTVNDFCAAANRSLKTRGRLFLVHRADRLVDVICGLRENSLEPKKIQFITGDIKKSPSLFLCEAVKLGGSELNVLPMKTL
ncbi:MAG: methyltransferase [Clostridiales bacterium]|nr:methyltransferase [Clostridiales bacterium]